MKYFHLDYGFGYDFLIILLRNTDRKYILP